MPVHVLAMYSSSFTHSLASSSAPEGERAAPLPERRHLREGGRCRHQDPVQRLPEADGKVAAGRGGAEGRPVSGGGGSQLRIAVLKNSAVR